VRDGVSADSAGELHVSAWVRQVQGFTADGYAKDRRDERHDGNDDCHDRVQHDSGRLKIKSRVLSEGARIGLVLKELFPNEDQSDCLIVVEVA
jgi:hypothetical protein